MTDIVTRLRGVYHTCSPLIEDEIKDAADEIARLRRELAEARADADLLRKAIDEACNIEDYDDNHRMHIVREESRRFWGEGRRDRAWRRRVEPLLRDLLANEAAYAGGEGQRVINNVAALCRALDDVIGK